MHSLNEVYSSLSQRRRYEVWFLRLGLADGSGAWWLRYLLSSPGRGGCAGETRVDAVQKALMDVVMQRADHKPATARAPRAEGKEAGRARESSGRINQRAAGELQRAGRAHQDSAAPRFERALAHNQH